MLLYYYVIAGLFSTNDVHQILKEVVKMKDFKHHNIMPLIGDTTLGVVMPFMENGSVLSYLKKHKETLLLNDDADIEEVSIMV